MQTCAPYTVHDSNIAAIKQTIAEAEDTLKEGMLVVIFP